jgi:serine/arginine repetitive matrix protein 1
MQINLTGFLTNFTPDFMVALWSLLLEAQDSPAGVPRTFVEEKKKEIRESRERATHDLERDRRARLDYFKRGGFIDGGRGRGRGGRGRAGFEDDRDGRARDSGWGTRGGGPGVSNLLHSNRFII